MKYLLVIILFISSCQKIEYTKKYPISKPREQGYVEIYMDGRYLIAKDTFISNNRIERLYPLSVEVKDDVLHMTTNIHGISGYSDMQFNLEFTSIEQDVYNYLPSVNVRGWVRDLKKNETYILDTISHVLVVYEDSVSIEGIMDLSLMTGNNNVSFATGTFKVYYK